jgi:hypothetical protein
MLRSPKLSSITVQPLISVRYVQCSHTRPSSLIPSSEQLQLERPNYAATHHAIFPGLLVTPTILLSTLLPAVCSSAMPKDQPQDPHQAVGDLTAFFLAGESKVQHFELCDSRSHFLSSDRTFYSEETFTVAHCAADIYCCPLCRRHLCSFIMTSPETNLKHPTTTSADRSEPPHVKNCSTTAPTDAKYVFHLHTFMLAFLEPWLVDAKFGKAMV